MYHNPDSDDCQHHRDIMGRSAEDFFIKTRQLLALSGASFRDIYAAATKETTCQTSMATLQEIAEQLATIPSRDRMEYDRLFGLSKYDMHDTLQATMSKINSEDISTANEMSECVSLVEPVVTAFIIHIYKSHSSLLPAAELAMDEMDQKLNDAPTLSASQLLLGRYKHNAEALLMMRCGKCDKSVSLLYSKNLHVEMTARQKSLLDLLAPFKEDDQITLLRGFVAFSGASIAPATFISALFCIWAKVRPPSLVELCDSGVLHTDLAAFMESVIVMLVDIERRLAAQLALYRAYPKVYVACCGSAHCFMCKVKGHHAGKTCEDVQSELIGTEAQYCPGCGVPTLRTEGCHQILCVCGMSWQWKGGDDPNDVNYNFNDGGSDSFDDIEDDENSFNSSESDIDVA